MKALYLISFLCCATAVAQSPDAVVTEEVPTTKIRHLARYCDATFVEDEAQKAVENPDSVKEQLWKKEQDYWKFLKEYDLVSYLKLWDDRILGYPGGEILTDKAHIVSWIDRMRGQNKGAYDYRLTRKFENIFDDVALVCYDVDQIWMQNGKVVRKSGVRIFHTWRFQNGEWNIIGAMDAER